ncbi:hypothetical protein Hypma_014321 [Hypsizygus marmoreus]|uniref:Fungal-type protein kinase domain-containing protein n=1 Tax=Hypsizygus marmoreus TaxID=39966 RepID=A0A369JEQ4_HYPMA|nr:hypothetical protein Hypma_014321 [Hypsizygus marmoreus]
MPSELIYSGPHRPPQAPDTGLKKSTAYIATGTRTRAAMVLEMVKDDAKGNCHVAETEEFLDNLFPVQASIVTNVYQKMVESGAYDEGNMQWKNLPKSSKKESDYYAPFVAAAEAIRRAHGDIEGIPYRNIWIARPNRAPKSQDSAAPLIRPDVLSILGMEGESEQWETLIANSSEEAEKLKTIVAWWLRVHVVVEIKPVEGKDILEHIYQLMGYLRQVLREQVDRRFVPGMLLCKTELSVWLADRSGVLGTQTTFNVHERPKRFIQTILACSILPAERLGWDSSMRLCRHPILPDPSPIHSFDKRVNLNDYRQSLYDQHWVIEMPSKEKEGRVAFVTIRALSVIRAENMAGRATIVWAVMRMDHLGRLPPHKIFVLKQCWRPMTAISEGELYPSGDHNIHINRIYSFEDVSHDCQLVDTQYYTRRGILHRPPSTRPDRNENGKRENDQLEDAERREPYIHVTAKSDHSSALSFATDSDSDPIWRVQTRILLEDYGWPLHHFSDLLELVTVLKHAIEALRDLYFLGVLHRDLSISNILICRKDSDEGYEGRLIDLDYAKKTVNMRDPLVKLAKTAPKRKVVEVLLESEFQPATDEVVRVIGMFNANHYDFINMVSSVNPEVLKSTEIQAAHIGLLKETQKMPDFRDHVPQRGTRSATFPFASSEVLSDERIFERVMPLDSSRNESEELAKALGITRIPTHNEKHDAEAVFWGVNFLGVTRDGPGGKRREELQPHNQADADRELLLVNYCLFSSEDRGVLARNKRELLKSNEDYETYIQSQFSSYFGPLKPLLMKWWKILRLAHKYPMFEATHEWIIQALDETIADLEKQQLKDTRREAVIERRKQDLRSLQYFPGPNEGGPSVPVAWDLSPTPDVESAYSSYRDGTPQSPTPKPKKAKT